MSSEAEVSNCAKCKNEVAEKGLQCEFCMKWFHPQCVGVASKNYDWICKMSNLHWFCDLCNSDRLMEEFSNFRDFRVQHQKLEEKICNLSNRLNKSEELIQKIDRQMSKSVNLAQCSNDDVSNRISDIVKEELEIEKRKLNVCVSGLNCEPGTDDVLIFKKLCMDSLGLPQLASKDIVSVRRVGQGPAQINGKPSNLIVQLSSSQLKKDILMNSSKLKDSASTRSIFISQDLTRRQQLKSKALRDELKRRQAGGERVIIRNGAIVPEGGVGPTLLSTQQA